MTRFVFVLSAAAFAWLADAGAAQAQSAPKPATIQIEGQTCRNVNWVASAVATVQTRRGFKRARRRADRRWREAVRDMFGERYASLANAKHVSRQCVGTRCSVRAFPCDGMIDKR